MDWRDVRIMNKEGKWGKQETLALIWLVFAIIFAISFSIWQDLSIPLFTILFLLPPLINLLTKKDARLIGMGSIPLGQTLKWAGINLAALILVYAIFEPWSGAYAFLLEEATAPGATDPTFFWLKEFGGLGGWIGMLLFSGVVSIFAEEICFRGWLLNFLRPKIGSFWANIIQALIFTLPQLIVVFIMPSPIMGIVYGLVYAFGAIGMINGWVASQAGAIWPNLAAASIMNLILSVLILT